MCAFYHCRLMNVKKNRLRLPTVKQFYKTAKPQRIFLCGFSHLALQGIVCYTIGLYKVMYFAYAQCDAAYNVCRNARCLRLA